MAGPLEGIDVAVIAGGLGTRIRPVLGETPKVLAPIHERPFLDYLLDWLAGFGAKRVVLCLGHRAEAVTRHLADHPHGDLEVATVVEPAPLGTGGALRFARDAFCSDTVLAMNGDTWIDTDLAAFVESHRTSGADISLLCVPVDDVARFGRVELDAAGRITRFTEKDPAVTGPGVINGGVYLFGPRGLAALMAAEGPSLERDFLQTLPAGTIHGYVAKDARFVDIGTPESLEGAGDVLPSARGRGAP